MAENQSPLTFGADLDKGMHWEILSSLTLWDTAFLTISLISRWDWCNDLGRKKIQACLDGLVMQPSFSLVKKDKMQLTNVWLKQCVTSVHILFFTNWCIMLLKCIEHHTQFFLPLVESVTLRYWFLPNALVKIKWLMRGWERGFNSPLFSSPPLLLASLVPTGGHQPHDSTSLPVGPSEIPPLYFSDFFSFLLLFLKNSDIQEAEKFLGKKRYIEVLTRQTMCSVARDEFGNVGFDHRFRPRPLSGSKLSLLLLFPRRLSSYSLWFRGQQHTQTSCHHSNTLHEKDFHLLISTSVAS